MQHSTGSRPLNLGRKLGDGCCVSLKSWFLTFCALFLPADPYHTPPEYERIKLDPRLGLLGSGCTSANASTADLGHLNGLDDVIVAHTWGPGRNGRDVFALCFTAQELLTELKSMCPPPQAVDAHTQRLPLRHETFSLKGLANRQDSSL